MACAVAVRALPLAVLFCFLLSQKQVEGNLASRSRLNHPRNGHAEVHNALQTFNVTGLSVLENTEGQNGIVLQVNTTSFNETGVPLFSLSEIPHLLILPTKPSFPQGAILKVSWSNTPFPAYEDIIALYTQDASPTTTAPIKFQWAARSPSHMHTGSGSVTFRLVNMRTGVRAAFIRNGLASPLLVARSDVVSNTNPHAPSGVHLALTGQPGEMMVQWTASNESVAPFVAWGVTPGHYDHRVEDGYVVTYTRAELCGGYATTVGWMHPGMLQRVLLTGLPADSMVYYVVGDQVFGKEGGEDVFE